MPVFFFYKYYLESEFKMNINLQPQVAQTKDGLYAVTYASLVAPLNVQEAAFAAHDLHTVSKDQERHRPGGQGPLGAHERAL